MFVWAACEVVAFDCGEIYEPVAAIFGVGRRQLHVECNEECHCKGKGYCRAAYVDAAEQFVLPHHCDCLCNVVSYHLVLSIMWCVSSKLYPMSLL